MSLTYQSKSRSLKFRGILIFSPSYHIRTTKFRLFCQWIFSPFCQAATSWFSIWIALHHRSMERRRWSFSDFIVIRVEAWNSFFARHLCGMWTFYLWRASTTHVHAELYSSISSRLAWAFSCWTARTKNRRELQRANLWPLLNGSGVVDEQLCVQRVIARCHCPYSWYRESVSRHLQKEQTSITNPTVSGPSDVEYYYLWTFPFWHMSAKPQPSGWRYSTMYLVSNAVS
jgi:hypothetical protein